MMTERKLKAVLQEALETWGIADLLGMLADVVEDMENDEVDENREVLEGEFSEH